jgi:hypothetical protein
MAIHVFRYRDTDVFALTYDQAGGNLPVRKADEWRFIETFDPLIETLGSMRFTWGEKQISEALAQLDLNGFFLFEGEMVPLRPPAGDG